ncbi:MAG: polysaccharide export protein [Verrucomicrobia bacterium]|nr:polysaccharide export protein [Verrucomicrobiota bacterium]
MKTSSFIVILITVLAHTLSAQSSTIKPDLAPAQTANAIRPASGLQSNGAQTVNPQAATSVTTPFSATAPSGMSVPPATPPLSIPVASMLYVIRPSDVLQITVYREPDLTSMVRLAADGSITFPLIGRVVLSGLTVQQAQDLLAQKLGADYLVDPQVMVGIAEFTKQHFTILGQVQKPGAYDLPIDGKLTILQAVGIAGGFTRIASPSRIVVKRITKEKKEQVIKINVTKLANKSSDEEFYVQEGDAITVPESYF